MAWKGKKREVLNPDKLRSILVNAKVQQENPALFQTIDQMLDINGQFKGELDNKLGKEDKIATSKLEGKVPISNGGTLTGLYTPDITLVANIAGVGVDPTLWIRIGDYVYVSGMFQANPIAFNVTTQIGFSLPLKSYFGFDYHCAGVAVCPFVRNECAAIYGDVVNNRAQIEWISGYNGVPQSFFYNFTYRIIQQ